MWWHEVSPNIELFVVHTAHIRVHYPDQINVFILLLDSVQIETRRWCDAYSPYLSIFTTSNYKTIFFFSLCTTFYTTFFRWVEIVKATFFCFVAYFHWMFNWNGINRCLRHLRSKFLIKSAFCFSGHWSFSCLINSKLSEMYKYFAVLFHCDDWQFYHQNWFRMWAERRRKKK